MKFIDLRVVYSVKKGIATAVRFLGGKGNVFATATHYDNIKKYCGNHRPISNFATDFEVSKKGSYMFEYFGRGIQTKERDYIIYEEHKPFLDDDFQPKMAAIVVGTYNHFAFRSGSATTIYWLDKDGRNKDMDKRMKNNGW